MNLQPEDLAPTRVMHDVMRGFTVALMRVLTAEQRVAFAQELDDCAHAAATLPVAAHVLEDLAHGVRHMSGSVPPWPPA